MNNYRNIWRNFQNLNIKFKIQDFQSNLSIEETEGVRLFLPQNVPVYLLIGAEVENCPWYTPFIIESLP